MRESSTNDSESAFLLAAARVLDRIEDAIERAGIDADCSRADLVLTIECEDGARIVVNAQAPLRQVWLASARGGRHFAAVEQSWRDVRDGAELFATLSSELALHCDRSVDLR